jgi:hypothetical protein
MILSYEEMIIFRGYCTSQKVLLEGTVSSSNIFFSFLLKSRVTISKKARKMKRTLYISLQILGRTRTAKEVRKFVEIIASEESDKGNEKSALTIRFTSSTKAGGL